MNASTCRRDPATKRSSFAERTLPLAHIGRLLLAGIVLLVLGACGSSLPAASDPLAEMREAAADSSDGEVLGRWLLGELVAPGGQPPNAAKARARLDATPAAKGMFASLSRAVDDEAHGHFRAAARAHLDAIAAARVSQHPDAALVAWFSANQLLRLRSSVQDLWKQAEPVVERTLDHPGNVGWRARGELVEWWAADAFQGAEPASGMLDKAARRHGCVENARLAGPFGHVAPSDHRTHYDAERPGPWPLRFTADPQRLEVPRILSVERHGCQLRSADATGPGIFYVETFLELPGAREIVLAVQGSLAVFVDDVEVLTRDTAVWGIWPRFGARLRLEAGRHRLLARIASAETSIRLLTPSGTPLDVQTSSDPAPPYSIAPPERLPDPNALEPFMTAMGVAPQKGTPPRGARDVSDPIARYLAAYLTNVEGQQDVSAVLLEPLVRDPAKATAQSLAMQAMYIEKDPIFPGSDARDMARDLRERAIAKDPKLWWPRLWLVLDEADKKGWPEMAPHLMHLADEFREVPDILKGLATMYAKMGWRAEHVHTVKEAAHRFPDDIEALQALLGLYDEQGRVKEADQVALQIRKMDPTTEVDFERAVQRRDYRAAIKELERLGALRKDRKDIALRIADLLTRAGLQGESMQKLEQAVRRSPTDASARLALADARFAAGDRGALRKALVDAIQTGAETDALRGAIELVEGMTELEPFRQDGKKVIHEFEASGQKLPGNAARVLDYAAMWIHTDGSARMLEHEIICIQSREAIQEHAEQQVKQGLILKLRTIKKDGRILEPEIVENKPTVTMPHLEIGDYIETEVIMNLRGDGQGGRVFQGPRWFFREEKLAYFRSEFITVSPKDRPLVVESGGQAPTPEVKENGALVTRRWRVDKTPAVPEEPGSAPIQEFLPNVRIGWGVTLNDTLARMVDAASDETPRDPRLLRIARSIVSEEAHATAGARAGEKRGVTRRQATTEDAEPPKARALTVDEKARRIYRWVVANIEPGREADGRRVVIGGSGSRTEAFMYLSRLLGLKVSLGLVRDRLTAEPKGPFSEAESFNALAVRLETEKGARWFLVHDKFAPYGYLPSSMRGQPVVLLEPGMRRETTPVEGSEDGIVHVGTAELSPDGSAKVDLEEQYQGKFAIQIRTALEQVPEARLKETIESRLLPQILPGARVKELTVKNLDDLDSPLVLAMKLEITNFARPRGNELVISPPFALQISNYAALPVRETPLYLSESFATRVVVRLRVKLPAKAHVATSLGATSIEDGGRKAAVRDRMEGEALFLDRVLDIPAGRVQPEAYAGFQDFARRTDAAMHRDIVIGLTGGAAR